MEHEEGLMLSDYENSWWIPTLSMLVLLWMNSLALVQFSSMQGVKELGESSLIAAVQRREISSLHATPAFAINYNLA
ncbi:hypothetical protein RJT34_31939 [Clitoria ternatea]|uniref:Uncharacterized protein n=1 Tax=Clitoria ternatea TaxID=43366 RepID=A0AAN9EV43_CLITE